MKNNLFEINGLRFWSEEQLHIRNMLKEHFNYKVQQALLNMNPSWKFVEIEASLLTPRDHVNQDYGNDDIWVQENKENHEQELVLRPETTPGSYKVAKYLIEEESYKPPFVVSQFGKSFRREQEQPHKHCRFKEFYQYEFQCFFAKDTMNDYHSEILEPMRKMIGEMIQLPTRIIESDRTPKYSEITTDIEVENDDKWMEVCSISRRTDVPFKARFNTKKGVVSKELYVLEIAIGMDRCVYNYEEGKKYI